MLDDAPTCDQLLELVRELSRCNAELERIVKAQSEEIAELRRRLALDSSKSSRPPSSDAPWGKKPAKKRSGRTRSGRHPGKQPGQASVSRLADDPHDRRRIEPPRCQRCDMSLAGAPEERVQRRQLVDTHPAPPPTITEYQRVSKRCPTCETVTTPGWDDVAVPVEHAEIVSAPGSPVRIGPETIARAALLTCAHYLPIGRARELLEALTGIDVSTGFLAGTADARRGGWKKASRAPPADAAGQRAGATRRRDSRARRQRPVLGPRRVHRIADPAARRGPLRRRDRRRRRAAGVHRGAGARWLRRLRAPTRGTRLVRGSLAPRPTLAL